MTTIQVCRTCLAHDTRMFTIVNSPLHKFYERITNSTCNMEDEKPLAVCYICYHLLQKYHRFTESAVKADEVLQQMYNSKIQITEKYMARIDKTLLFKFQMSPVLTVGIDSDNVDIERAEIKTEFQSDQGEMALDANKDTNQENTMDFVIKTETVLETSEGEDEDEDESCREDPLHSPVPSEFDDDEPLSSFSVNKEDVVVEKKSVPKKVTKAGTMRRKLDRNTKPQEKLEVTSKEDIGAENATNSITKSEGFNLDISPYKSLLIEKINCRYFVCKFCDLKFAQKRELAKHVKTHTVDETFTCNHCGQKFLQKYYLVRHSRIHTGEKPFKCNYCEKKFRQSCHLVSHLRMHTGEKPFKCNYCEKTFTQNYYLKSHLRMHTGEKPFKCNYCEKTFTQNYYLKSHLRMHTGEKPFKCTFSLCEKKYKTKTNLKRHLQKHGALTSAQTNKQTDE